MKRKFLKVLCLSFALVSLFNVTGFCCDNKSNDIINTTVGYNDATLLHYACKIGDLNTVKYLLERGSFLDTCDFDGNMPIHYACANGHLDIVKYLLENGVSIESKGCSGRTPLHIAASNGYTDIVKYLLDNGALVNTRDNYENTPLHISISNEDVVSLLLERGAAIEAYDLSGFTPLHNACLFGSDKSCKVLLEHGANVNAKTATDRYSYRYFARNIGNDSPIHFVREKEKMALLLKYGADINAKNMYNESPLTLACSYSEDYDLVKYLLENGADINNIDEYGYTPLIRALGAYIPDRDIIMLLLDNGADVNIKTNDNESALEWALRTGFDDVIKVVTEKSSKDIINQVLINNFSCD